MHVLLPKDLADVLPSQLTRRLSFRWILGHAAEDEAATCDMVESHRPCMVSSFSLSRNKCFQYVYSTKGASAEDLVISRTPDSPPPTDENAPVGGGGLHVDIPEVSKSSLIEMFRFRHLKMSLDVLLIWAKCKFSEVVSSMP